MNTFLVGLVAGAAVYSLFRACVQSRGSVKEIVEWIKELHADHFALKNRVQDLEARLNAAHPLETRLIGPKEKSGGCLRGVPVEVRNQPESGKSSPGGAR